MKEFVTLAKFLPVNLQIGKKEVRLESTAVAVEDSDNYQYPNDDHYERPHISFNVYSSEQRDPYNYYYHADD